MAQTTDTNSFVDAEIEISTNGSAWTDISGFANELSVDPGQRKSGAIYTADGDTPILGSGKREPMMVKVTTAYTEGTGDPFETVRTQYQTDGGGALYVRWSPRGGDNTEFQFTTGAGIVKVFNWPGGPVETGDPQTVIFEVEVAEITKAVISA